MGVRTLVVLAGLTSLLPASAASGDDPSKIWARHLSEKAFGRAEPRLQALEPGMALDETGIRWEYFKLVKRRKTTGTKAESDGWIGPLSGGMNGAAGGLGVLTGLSEEYLYGQHVFGYLWGNATVVPRYVVKTRARRATEAENSPIDRKIVGAAGKLEYRGRTFFYRDVTVEEVREMRFAPPDMKRKSTQTLPIHDLKEFFASRATPESFAGVLSKIETLEPGCEVLDAVAELGGVYVTFNGAKNLFLPLEGYLGPWLKKDEYPQLFLGETSMHEIWPFGFLEKETPRVQLALVFRNGSLITVLEEASKEAVEAYLAGERRPDLAPTEAAPPSVHKEKDHAKKRNQEPGT
jgi:hypothetical protein